MGLFKNRGSDRELIPIGWALTLVLVAAVGIAGGLLWLAWALLGAPAFTREQVQLSSYLDIVKIVLAVVAGIGGVVALVVAYRRQRTGERAEQREHARLLNERTRLLNERFDLASNKLGSDQAAVRLAGVHAIANLADDWDDHEARQMCIDVLCSYLRMAEGFGSTESVTRGSDDATSEEVPGSEISTPALGLPGTDRETRHTILRVIAAHLRKDGATVPWSGHEFDLRGITIDLNLNFTNAEITRGTLVNLTHAQFKGGVVWFVDAQFSGGFVSFAGAQFSGSHVLFADSQFSSGDLMFADAVFSSGVVSFVRARFSGSTVSFSKSQVAGADVVFIDSQFSSGEVGFDSVQFSSGATLFCGAQFSGSQVSFAKAHFDGGLVELSTSIWDKPPEGIPDSASGLLLPPASDDPDGGNRVP